MDEVFFLLAVLGGGLFGGRVGEVFRAFLRAKGRSGQAYQ